jgi:prepilin-type N-terminal cleavage/methylation domain-containing protein
MMKSVLHQDRGFTLIELTVVVVIIGLTMALTMPRFNQNILSDDLKASARSLAGLITNLSREAIRENTDYRLYFDLSENCYWTEKPGLTAEGRMLAKEKAVKLPEDVHVIDIMKKGDEKRSTGEIPIMITRKGYLQPAAIHLGADEGRVFTLYLKTFIGKVEILNGYLEYEE